MSLPKIDLPRMMVDVAGTEMSVRGLTRSESLKVAELLNKGDQDAAENYGLSCGCDETEEDMRAWRNSVPSGAVQALVDAIAELSGLNEGAQKSS